jgi:uncharacterized protein YcbK (DUF882 family)
MSVANTEHDAGSGRRDFLKKSIFIATGLMAMPGFMRPAFASFGSHKVFFRNAHTGESFSGAYRIGDKYLPEAFRQINHIMRDFRTGDVKMIDPHLVDLMYWLHYMSGSSEPFEIVSGYRSPETNARLRRASSGVAKRSLHMEGRAVDLRLEDTALSRLRKLAIDMKAGGVGFYPRSNFIHIDTGRVRQW